MLFVRCGIDGKSVNALQILEYDAQHNHLKTIAQIRNVQPSYLLATTGNVIRPKSIDEVVNNVCYSSSADKLEVTELQSMYLT